MSQPVSELRYCLGLNNILMCGGPGVNSAPSSLLRLLPSDVVYRASCTDSGGNKSLLTDRNLKFSRLSGRRGEGSASSFSLFLSFSVSSLLPPPEGQ